MTAPTKKPISRSASCPCGSGRKYKKCCMPSEERSAGGGDSPGPFGGRGPASHMVEFSQPLIEAAGDDHQAIEKALQFGMVFWNLGVVAETGDDEFVREQLSMLDNEISRTGGGVREFRPIAAMMLARYAAMRPAARACLERSIVGAWRADLSSAIPKPGWAGRIAGAAKRILSREAQIDGD